MHKLDDPHRLLPPLVEGYSTYTEVILSIYSNSFDGIGICMWIHHLAHDGINPSVMIAKRMRRLRRKKTVMKTNKLQVNSWCYSTLYSCLCCFVEYDPPCGIYNICSLSLKASYFQRHIQDVWLNLIMVSWTLRQKLRMVRNQSSCLSHISQADWSLQWGTKVWKSAYTSSEAESNSLLKSKYN